MEIARITGRNTFQRPITPSTLEKSRILASSLILNPQSLSFSILDHFTNFNELQFRLQWKLCFTKNLSTRSNFSILSRILFPTFFVFEKSINGSPCARHSLTSISLLGKQYCRYDNTCRKLAIHMDETAAWWKRSWKQPCLKGRLGKGRIGDRHMATMGQSNR